ncbi:MAG: lytic murein transglycosylase [Smithellaceae bacterium]|nr:lytic murein transglycosylase [Smithellaceae bacterium]
MSVSYLLIAFAMTVMLIACAGSGGHVKKSPEIKTDSGSESISTEGEKTEEHSILSESDEFAEALVAEKMTELKQRLARNGVPEEWFDEQTRHESFQVHSSIARYFQRSAEKQVDYDKQRDEAWYFARLGVEAKIEKGKMFIEAHKPIFNMAEAKHGIHKELIAAILGIETNFADRHQRGNFYAFNSLVSQYVFTKRKKFAVREIAALYKFSKKTGHPPQYFTSSYAGAIGWGQFIPSSLLAFFVDSNGIHEDTDPFSLEDTIFSIENYLYRHNLSGNNIDDPDAKYKAVFAYNHSDIYVSAVLYIYEGLRDYARTEKPEESVHLPEDEVQSTEEALPPIP